MSVNKALIDEIVTNVLAKLRSSGAPSISSVPVQASTIAAVPVIAPAVVTAPVVAVPAKPATDTQPAVELLAPVITADLLENSVLPGQVLKIGRTSILTPSARDWLNSKRTAWSRQDKSAAASNGVRSRWQIILQTVTPNVKSLQEGIRKLADGWKVDLVGQPAEAATLATSLISTADCDGVVIFTEQADLIACKANRNDRVRAAVVQSSRQWEQVMSTLSANVVCISPVGRTFIELRNLLRDCARRKPQAPAGW